MHSKCYYFNRQTCLSCDFKEESQSLEQRAFLLKKHFGDIPIDYRSTNSTPLGFRNKAKLAVFTHDKQIGLGITKTNLEQIDISECPLYTEGIKQLIPVVRNLIKLVQIPIYNILEKTGELKYVIIIGNKDSSQHILRFVLKSKQYLSQIQNIVPKILATYPSIKIVSVNLQPIPHAVVEGNEEIILTDATFIEENIGEYKFFVGPKCFFQTNVDVASDLYHTFQAWIKDQELSSALDLYCGVGGFSFFASKFIPTVTGVEITPESINSAKLSLKNSRLTNLEFLCKDAFNHFNQPTTIADAVIVNPPRRGLGKDLCQSLVEKKGIKILYYSSCNAQTLIQDFEILKSVFKPNRIAVFDMFPYTSHYETLIEFKPY